MKQSYLLLLSVLFIVSLSVGCQVGSPTTLISTESEPVSVWLNYYPTQCNPKPWGDTLEQATIQTYYQNLGVMIEAMEVTAPPAGFVSCAACGCSTGIQVSIQTDAAGQVLLEDLGFTTEEVTAELDLVDEVVTTDTTTTNTNTVTDETVAEMGVEEAVAERIETDETLVIATAEDQELETRAGIVQSALQDYYSKHGSYPDSLADLVVTVDFTGMTYTPIGITPADYYDLSVDYSTGRLILNP